MKMANENIVIPTLSPEDIEVKIKQVTEKGALALLYKTARTDMRILDEVYGVNNWQIDYQMIGDMLFCTIYIWDEEKNQWVKKQSNGVESREDGEGNEVKGLASDCMKRAGFMLGIGRELYSSPFIWLKLETVPDKKVQGKWVLKNPFDKFVVTDIQYDAKRKISKLVIANQKTGEIVYQFGTSSTKKVTEKPQSKQTTTKEAEKKPETVAPVAQQKAEVTKVNSVPRGNEQPWEKHFRDFVTKHNLTKERFIELRAKAVLEGKDITQKSFKELSPDEWETLLKTMESLFENGFFEDGK